MNTQNLTTLATWLKEHDGLIKFDLCTWHIDALGYCVKIWENQWTWNEKLMPVLNEFENTCAEMYIELSAVKFFDINADDYKKLFFPGTQDGTKLNLINILSTPNDIAENIFLFIKLNKQAHA